MPARGEVEPRHQVHERRLAGAVRADQSDDLVPAQLERHVVERLHALERARDGARPQRSLRRRAVGDVRQGWLVSGTVPRWPRTTPGATADRVTSTQTFGTTFATTEPMTFSLLPSMRITRYCRPNTLCCDGREADEARERRHLLELHHLGGQRRAVRRVARAGVGGDEAVDRGRAGDEAAGAGLDGLGELVDGRVRVIAERRGVGHGVVVRDAGLRHPVGAVAGPRVEDRRLVAERAHARDERGELAERRSTVT